IIQQPKPCADDNTISGNIDILDVRFGNLWTNIPRKLFKDAAIAYGDTLEVTIRNNNQQVYKNSMTFGRSFADSHLGEPLLYVNSVDKLGVAINQDHSQKHMRLGQEQTGK